MSSETAAKELICEIGRRVYAKGFAAANEGNLSIRLNEDQVLCTPTLQCKGFMEPDDICLVDFAGQQLAGRRKRTSEVRLHLEIYRRRPEVRGIVHCHPPHATAFAVAREPIPRCVLPEPDIFLGEVPIARYATPGNQDFADTILPFVAETNTIVLANHGTVSYDADLEKAYWLTEILDAYCRILILARQLGGIQYLSREEGQALLDLRVAWGMPDARQDLDSAGHNICDHLLSRPSWPETGVAPRAFPTHPSVAAPPTPPAADPGGFSEEALERLADRIADRLESRFRSTDPT